MQKILHSIFILLIFNLAIWITPVSAQENATLTRGTQVIVLPHTLPVHLSASHSAPIAAELWGGMVSRIVAITTNNQGENWFYLADNAYGWVPEIHQGETSLAPFSQALLTQMSDTATEQIAADPQNIDAYLQRGTIHLSRRDYQAAVDDYTQAINSAPQQYDLYEYRGEALFELAEYDAAISDFQQVIDFGSPLLSTHNRIALAYQEVDEFDLALSHYTDAFFFFEEDEWSLIYNNMGNLFSSWSMDENAIDAYEIAINMDPHITLPYYNRALVWREQNNPTAALDDFNRAIDRDMYDTDNYVQLGILYSEVYGNDDLAFKYFNVALSIDPTNARAYAAQGVRLSLTGDVDGAIDNLKQALALNPRNSHVVFTLAYLYSQQGRYRDALQSYTDAIDFSNDYDESATLYRGQVYLALAEYKLALDDLSEFLLIDYLSNEEYATAYIVRSAVYLNINDYQSAADDLIEAFNIYHDFTLDFLTWGRGYLVASHEDLLNELYIAQSQTPNDVSIYLQLGNIYMLYGYWGGALSNYQIALTLEDNPALKSFTETLESYIQ